MENLDPLAKLAQLSTREAEVLGLHCLDCSNAEIAVELKISPGTVKNYLHRARQKILAAQALWEREQRERELEERDAEDLERPRGFYGFLLGAMKLPKDAPTTPQIGLIWKEYDPKLNVETTLAQEGAAHAGPLVTVDDLVGVEVPECSAAENRERLKVR